MMICEPQENYFTTRSLQRNSYPGQNIFSANSKNHLVIAEPCVDENNIDFSLISFINEMSEQAEYILTGAELKQIFICYKMGFYQNICMMLNSAAHNRIKESNSKVEASMKTTNPTSAENPNYLWFLNNFEHLKQMYNGEWVAIYEQHLITHSNDYRELIMEIKKQNIKRPFVTRVVPESWE